MKRYVFFVFFCLALCSCESTEIRTHKEIFLFNPNRDPEPECPSLDDMKNKWIGKQWEGVGTVVHVVSGPNKRVVDIYVFCEYEFEVHPSGL